MEEKKVYKKVTSLEHINASRVRNGLPPIKYKWLQCLGCIREFNSTGPSNRLCGKCKSSDRKWM